MPPDSSTLRAGYFYLIQLLPKALPSRLKLGWTLNPAVRLRSHRCTCPDARIVRLWPCPPQMERPALRTVIDAGFRRIGPEVIDGPDLTAVVVVIEQHFAPLGVVGRRAVPQPSLASDEDDVEAPRRPSYPWSRARRWVQPRRAPSGTWYVQMALGGRRHFLSAPTRDGVFARMRALDKDYRQKLRAMELPDGADISGLFGPVGGVTSTHGPSVEQTPGFPRSRPRYRRNLVADPPEAP